MQKLLAGITILSLTVLFSSCGAPKNAQNVIYFKDTVTAAEKVVITKPTLIMPGDRLNINITAINKEAAEAFNAPQTGGGGAEGTKGYLVDSLGNIQLLQLGMLHVAGMTTARLRDTLQQQLVNYIKGPVVTVDIVNFKISVMGEVTGPGTVIVPDGQMTILEALNEAGDLTQFSRGEKILVIRETNGVREFGRVDITSNKLFNSPYYNLQQNDVIYVEPDDTKFIANDVVFNRNQRYLAVAMTLLSLGILIASIFN